MRVRDSISFEFIVDLVLESVRFRIRFGSVGVEFVSRFDWTTKREGMSLQIGTCSCM